MVKKIYDFFKNEFLILLLFLPVLVLMPFYRYEFVSLRLEGLLVVLIIIPVLSFVVQKLKGTSYLLIFELQWLLYNLKSILVVPTDDLLVTKGYVTTWLFVARRLVSKPELLLYAEKSAKMQGFTQKPQVAQLLKELDDLAAKPYYSLDISDQVWTTNVPMRWWEVDLAYMNEHRWAFLAAFIGITVVTTLVTYVTINVMIEPPYLPDIGVLYNQNILREPFLRGFRQALAPWEVRHNVIIREGAFELRQRIAGYVMGRRAWGGTTELTWSELRQIFRYLNHLFMLLDPNAMFPNWIFKEHNWAEELQQLL